MLLVAAALAFAMRDGVQRRLVLLVAIPFSLVWALGFSYDLRNIALAVPLVGAAAGIGVVGMGEVFVLNRKRAATRAPINAIVRKGFGTSRVSRFGSAISRCCWPWRCCCWGCGSAVTS